MNPRTPKPPWRVIERFPGRQIGVPRRFGTGILLLITAMYAVLFAVLRACGVPPVGFALIAIFFTAVGLGQMLLFKGRNPRVASIVVGAVLMPIMYLAEIAYWKIATKSRLDVDSDLCAGGCCGCIGGAIHGYLAGLLIAGVFLVIDRVACRFRKTSETPLATGADATIPGANPFSEPNEQLPGDTP